MARFSDTSLQRQLLSKLAEILPKCLAFGNTEIGNISPPRINLLPLTYYNNTMISLEELENQCLPISKLKKYATEWGTKIQMTLFNKNVHAWNKSFQLNQSYYIINEKLNGAKPNFLSVNKAPN
ncbi:hypothetical protein H5410_013232 [Solanum commersonii]|uniref:Uncharacterized protein n=1 Tax=Solanum commersonii TaxID=4109 RepID=A0A9J6ATZ1_SOLCO|nr:hypothetical protein H5410_013232 [Solanum commersonii]